jgi:hypothetical protein
MRCTVEEQKHTPRRFAPLLSRGEFNNEKPRKTKVTRGREFERNTIDAKTREPLTVFRQEHHFRPLKDGEIEK